MATPTSQERVILDGISRMASPGEILPVLGPSGSGKSTLLNALADRLGYGLTGTILANVRKLTRSVRRGTGFVALDDMLYLHLTVLETLVFCALLRDSHKGPEGGGCKVGDRTPSSGTALSGGNRRGKGRGSALIKHISTTFYCYRLLIDIQYGHDQGI